MALLDFITTFAVQKITIKTFRTMARRKYEYYILITECDEDNYNNYSEAVSAYWKNDSATLYGSDEQGGLSVIMSK